MIAFSMVLFLIKASSPIAVIPSGITTSGEKPLYLTRQPNCITKSLSTITPLLNRKIYAILESFCVAFNTFRKVNFLKALASFECVFADGFYCFGKNNFFKMAHSIKSIFRDIVFPRKLKISFKAFFTSGTGNKKL